MFTDDELARLLLPGRPTPSAPEYSSPFLITHPGHLPADSRRGPSPARSPPPARCDVDGGNAMVMTGLLQAEQDLVFPVTEDQDRAASPLITWRICGCRTVMGSLRATLAAILPGVAHRHLPSLLRACGAGIALPNPVHAAAQFRHAHPDAVGRRRQRH